MNDQSERMRAIKEEVLNLTGSPLYEERIRTMAYPVIGEGSHEARVMFVGEAPGRNAEAGGATQVSSLREDLEALRAQVALLEARLRKIEEALGEAG